MPIRNLKEEFELNLEQRRMSRDRERSRERDIPPANTNSSDPKLMNARVFIGNLATDKIGRIDLVNVFGKYGKILGISLLRGYGFIQYETEEEGRAAVSAENGVMMKGQRIDVKMAAEGRRKPIGADRPARRSPPPRERERARPIRDRSPLRDPYERDPYERDPYDDPYRRPLHRDPYARERDPYARAAPLAAEKSSLRLTKTDPYADPYREARDPYLDPYRPLPAAPAAPAAPLVADCEIILLSTKLRPYADSLLRRLEAVGVISHQLPLSSPDSLPKALEDITRRGMLYAIVLNEQNEVHRSLTLNILHGTPQEHRNMPCDDAITLVQRNFADYRKKKAEAAKGTADFLHPDTNQSYLLNLLADNRFLTIDELDTVIKYLTQRKEQMLEKAGAKVGAAPALKEDTAIVQQQQELQAKILSILGGSSAPTPATSSPPLPAAASPAYASSSNTNINFSNPSVQQAIDNLMSTGGLKSMNNSTPAPAAPASSVTASAYAQPPSTPGVYQAYGGAGAPGVAAAAAPPAAVPQPPAGSGYAGYQYARY